MQRIDPRDMDSIRCNTRNARRALLKLANDFEIIGQNGMASLFRMYAEVIAVSAFDTEQVFQGEQEERTAL